MADKLINGSESVYTKQVGDNLILIDPNKIQSNDGHTIEDRLVRHEDLVTYVNLTARILPRSKLIAGQGASDAGVKIDLFDGEINFLKPGNKKSLDSDWTEAFTDPTINKIRRQEIQSEGKTSISKRIESKNDFQGFGIKGINIKLNSSFIPEVDIQFTDIRGKTLFEQGDVNTPYTAFFHLPYPVFELTLKGFYGRAVKYQLALLNFNASFDSNSGDYQVQAHFIGNHIALLNDINLQQAMVAPYMYPAVTEENSPEEVVANGLGKKILDEVYKIYKTKKLIPDDFPHLTIFELIGKVETFTQNLTKNFEKLDLNFDTNQGNYQNKLNDFWHAIFGDGGWVEEFIDPSIEPIIIDMTTGSANNNINEEPLTLSAIRLKSSVGIDEDVPKEIIDNAESKLKYILEGFKAVLGGNETFGLNKGPGSVEIIKEFTLENQRAEKYSTEVSKKGWYV